MLLVPRESLNHGINTEKYKHLLSSGYKQFGMLIGEKYGFMALVFHSEPPSTMPTPHIIGGPWVYLIPYRSLKRHRFGANVEIMTEGVIPVPPARGYLSTRELTLGKPLEELYPITFLGELALLPEDKEIRSKVYSYIFRPNGYTAVRPPITDAYDSEQWKIYKDVVVPLLVSKTDIISQEKRMKVSLEDKIHYFENLFKTLGKTDISDKITRFKQESSDDEMIIMLSNFCGKISEEEKAKIPGEFLDGIG